MEPLARPVLDVPGSRLSWRVDIELTVGSFSLCVDVSGDARPVAIVGENGSGKTTLLRAIAGTPRPDRGRIEIDGDVLFDADAGVMQPPEARRVGYVPQGYGLFPHLDVAGNVAFGLSVTPRRERRAAALAALSELDAAHLADRMPTSLSGGEAQRVALARALAVEPRILLLDEPLAALDATARRAVRAFLAERLRALRRPAVFVTHDVRDVAALGARVVVLERGRVVQHGELSDIREAPATPFVAEFVGIAAEP